MSFDRQQLAAVRYPTLMPDIARDIVDAEALAFVAIPGLVDFMQDTAVEYHLDPRMRDCNRGLLHVNHVPIANPEIKLPVCRCGARRRKTQRSESRHCHHQAQCHSSHAHHPAAQIGVATNAWPVVVVPVIWPRSLISKASSMGPVKPDPGAMRSLRFV